MRFTIERSEDFEEWLNTLNAKQAGVIYSRLSRIELYGHFGVYKYLGDYIYELKWKSGLRIYYTYLAETKIIMLLGGNKNGQKKDIKKARSLIG